MKKLGFIAIAMVTLLATLGIGFSMWSQTVTVNGIVNTGSVGFTLGAPTGTWAFKDVNTGAIIMRTGAVSDPVVTVHLLGDLARPSLSLPATGLPVVGNDTIILVGACYTTAISGNTATMNWYNIFPIAPFVGNDIAHEWCADLGLTNTSTIPVKFHAVISGKTGMDNLAGPVVTYTSGTTAPVEIALEGYQLEPGTTPLNINVCVGVPDANSSMSQSGSFTVTIQMVQWNEYLPGGLQDGNGNVIVP